MTNNTSEILFKIYNIIKSWLEYAEKKNAILLTIIGAELAIVKFISDSMNYEFIEFSLVFLIFAFLIALMSFYPKTDRFPFTKKPKKFSIAKNINLLFYGDIQKIDVESYLQLLMKNYNLNIECDKLAEDISDQIIILSKIANFKLVLFKFAIYFAIIGQITMFLLIMINMFFIK